MLKIDLRRMVRETLVEAPQGSQAAAWAWGLLLTLALRVGLGLVMGAAWTVISPFFPWGLASQFAFFDKVPVPTTFPGNVLLGVWPRWDAVAHLKLALRGYFDLTEADSVFYPLFALLTRLTAMLTRGDILLGGLVVATLATIAALAGLYRLTDMAYGPRSARWAVLALALYPTALFLVAPFTESLFLALTLWAFILAYEQKWWAAGGLAFLASLARGPGMLSAAALAVVAWQQWRARPAPWRPRQVVATLWGLAAPVAGGAAFLLWRAAVGFAPMQVVLQRDWDIVMTDPLTGLISAVAQWLHVHDLPTTLDLWSAVAFIALTGLMALRLRWRKWDWLAYSGLNLVLFLSKRSYTAASFQSMARYVLVLFPAFILIGDWLASRGPRARFYYLALSSALLLVLSILYTSLIFIG